ncbi:MAG TPA: beta-ketoacyl synthase N-terminal-like domain-containing protein [Pseudonocardiaceae bacterium]|nr:beta-ketoacyl synthase N-terminal-like domain-containing protein [Pseudonocardiaceae bacterium]
MTAAAGWDEESVRHWLVTRVAERTGTPERRVDAHRPLTELGLSSVDSVALTGELADHLGVPLPETLAWERPTIAALAARLVTETPDVPVPAAAPVAIVGLGCRFPGGAHGPAAYWDLLREGRDGVGPVPAGRWTGFDPPEELPGYGGFLAEVAGFDAEFFGITPREAGLMDPQQRIALEVAVEALEHAGLPRAAVRGSRTAVFVGVSAHEYAHLTARDLARIEAWTATGAAPSIIANRLSYLLDLRGPSMAIDTACSSALVAVHQAMRGLADGEFDRALVAGVNLLLTPAIGASFARAGALAPDGRCKAFDAAADGIVRGEGCGVVVLERLPDARRSGRRILAVLRGSAVNSDGRSNGLMAPNPVAQRDVLRRACASADVDESTVDYVEAHGTGTPLGDPIEASALGAVHGRGRAADRPLLLGSVKTNLGHLEGAAGLAGLIKVVLAMTHDHLPPSLHFRTANPLLRLAEDNLSVVARGRDWPRYSGHAVAGVSAFGFGGTNAHVVLEEWRAPSAAPTPVGAPVVLAVGDESAARVRLAAGNLAGWLAGTAAAPADLAHTLAVRRDPGAHRAVVLGASTAELRAGLTELAEGRRSVRRARVNPDVVWVFSGFGAQYPGMATGLLDTEPAFAAAIAELDPLFLAETGFSLSEAMRADRPGDLRRTQLTLFGVQLGLAAWWRSVGVRPAAVLGHSMGEVAAAVAVGALPVAAGLRVMAVRAGLLAGMETAGAGGMAVLGLTEAEFAGLATEFPDSHIAVYAAPGQLTVTGPAGQIRELAARVESSGRLARSLGVGGAGHSPAVDGLLDPLRSGLADLRPSAPEIGWYGTVHTDPRAVPECDAEYWAANVRQPVRFTAAVAAALQDGFRTFLEISPHPVVAVPIDETARAEGATGVLVTGTLRKRAEDRLAVAENIAALHTHGHPGVLAARCADGRLVDLPPRVWRHQRYWFAPSEPEATGPALTVRAAARLTAVEPELAERTAIERLRALAAEIGGFRAVELDEWVPLTELGLDSLMAQRMRNAVEREFAVSLPAPVLLRGACLAEVAELLPGRPLAGDPHTVLRLLRTGTDPGLAPLFLFHPAGGPTSVYRPLIDRLSAALTCYGLERLDDVTELPERAARYVELVRGAQPDGPYRLAGWSFGGCLAYEVAQQLRAAGARVELVALIDSVLPRSEPDPDGPLGRHRRFVAHLRDTYQVRLDVPWPELAELDEDARVHALLDLLKRADLGLSEAVLHHQHSSHVDTLAGERYRPSLCAETVVLYRAQLPHEPTVALDPRYRRSDADLGWAEFCADLRVVEVPGDHLSVIDPPHVDPIAADLDGRLHDGGRR